MKLWSLTKNESPQPATVDFILVRAETEREARLLAVGCDWRNPTIWSDPNLSDCDELSPDGIPEVLRVTYD